MPLRAMAGRRRSLARAWSGCRQPCPASAVLVLLLLWMTFEPLITLDAAGCGRAALELPATEGAAEPPPRPVYHRILVPLDHTELDRWPSATPPPWPNCTAPSSTCCTWKKASPARSTAAILHRRSGSRRGSISSASRNRCAIRELRWRPPFSIRPRRGKEIVRYAREIQPDLLIMGAHGHGGLKDLIFGNTINPVRHNLEVPMLIVRPGKG